MRKRILDILAAVLFALLAGLRLRSAMQDWLVWPLFFQAAIAALLFVARRPTRLESPAWQRELAWLCAMLPMSMNTAGQSAWYWETISFAGVSFSLWALISLGRSFGIAPADRELVSKGPYRLVRHPMYLGELLSYAPLISVDLWNVIVFLFVLAGIIIRILLEEKILESYDTYSKKVLWRLVPFIW